MKRLLLVDDEGPIISGLNLLIKRYFQDRYTVVGEAYSGREAIEKAKELSPDIILIDVQMPGISGLDAIRALSQSGHPIAFILITAYERFEIAREALRLGVCDYILKPVSRDRLEVALNSASLYLERLKIIEERELEYIEREQRLSPFLKEALFYTLTKEKKSSQDLGLLLKALKIPYETGCIAFAYFFPQKDSRVSCLYHRFSQLVHYKTEALVSDLIDNRYCLILIPVKGKQELGQFQQLIQKEFTVEQAIEELSITYGSIESYSNLQNSWETAFQSLLSVQTGLQEFTTLTWPLELDVSLLKEAEQGHLGSAGKKLEEILSRIARSEKHSEEEMFRILVLLGSLVLQLAQHKILTDETIKDLFQFRPLVSLWEKGLMELFIETVREHFTRISREAAEQRNYSPLIERALQYIKNHFSEPLTLESVADVVGVSPVTLSRLMSEELGMGFARTLIDHRIKKSQEMLRRGNLSIKEISTTCGYQDPNYFTRLFKSITGMTPREYISRNKEEVQDA
jgi:two-component system response regulator YesN